MHISAGALRGQKWVMDLLKLELRQVLGAWHGYPELTKFGSPGRTVCVLNTETPFQLYKCTFS